MKTMIWKTQKVMEVVEKTTRMRTMMVSCRFDFVPLIVDLKLSIDVDIF